MPLSNTISDFFIKDPSVKDKDNVLVVSIFFLTREMGWVPYEHDFGVDEHVAKYRKGRMELSMKGTRKGKNFELIFKGKGPATLPGATGNVREKVSLEMDIFVNEKLELRNEELLAMKVNSILQTIEHRIG